MYDEDDPEVLISEEGLLDSLYDYEIDDLDLENDGDWFYSLDDNADEYFWSEMSYRRFDKKTDWNYIDIPDQDLE